MVSEFFIFQLIAKLILVVSCSVSDGEVVYVTPTASYNADCPSDHQCHTLQYYFSNNSFTERSIDLAMIFLTGQHTGICKIVTTLKSTSLTIIGRGEGVEISCTNVELENASTIKFKHVTLDNWSMSCSHPPAALVVQMSAVIVQNHTTIHIQHALNSSGNIIELKNCIFRNSSLSGTLRFIDNHSDKYTGALTLVSTELTIKTNSVIAFSHNVRAMFLNSSTLNIESDVTLTFSNNIKAMTISNSFLNVNGRVRMTIMNNSVTQSQNLGTMTAFNSILNFENGVDIAFINNTGGETVMAVQMCTLHVRKNVKVAFISNGAYRSVFYVRNSTLNIEDNADVKFLNNLGQVSAGAMTLLLSSLNVGHEASIVFTNNKVIQMKGGSGAIIAHYSTVNINDNVSVTFTNNSGEIGGALAVDLSTTVNITNKAHLAFINNKGDVGGAIALFPISTMNIKNEAIMIFSNNSASSTGGALLLKSSTINIMHNTRIQFNNNNATSQAGALQAEGSSSINIADYSQMKFSGSSAQITAAIGLIFSTLSMSNISSIEVTSNRASIQCGGFHAENSIINVQNHACMNLIDNKSAKVGAVSLRLSVLNVRHNATISFINNTGGSQQGAIAAELSTINVENYANIFFVNNSAYAIGAIGLWTSTLNVRDKTNMVFINNTALNGDGGAILLVFSTLAITENSHSTIKLVSNSAKCGGAMAIISSSLQWMSSDSNLIFINNSASEFGGGIYIDPGILQLRYKYLIEINCLYYTLPNDTKRNISFINNSATIAGFDVYGASLFWCDGQNDDKHPLTNNTSLSAVSGVASRVCKCDNDNQPQCSTYLHTESVYPGETITIPLVLVGGDWGPTPGTVYASFRHLYTSSSVLSSQLSQLINSTQCTGLNYTLYTNQSVQLTLTAHSYHSPVYYYSCENITTDNRLKCPFYSPLYINLNLLPCPPGFSLQGDPPGCDCYPALTDNGVKCSINDRRNILFSWNTPVWINTASNNTIYSKYCPFDYCNNVKTIQNDVNNQCAFNRAGKLCGACKENYSLAIGSSHCIYCPTNNYLALIIFFAAAGFLLVLFISVLNLTISQGMINGLIFYANIVWTYQSILFPKQMPKELVFLKVFIAWLNLDFGIEMCFFNGLNAFWKTWLQFVFPFYIWSIAGLMIVAAKQSTRLTYLFGNRAVSILATLILLSYMKLFRTVVAALHFSILNVCSNEQECNSTVTVAVWSVDGNLDYIGYPHILLIVAALFTLLFLWLPYTLLLFLIQWMRRVSHLRFLKWSVRLNPFYDAHFAPLKPKHQYWFGVLLLARGMIQLSFSSSFAISEAVNLLVLLVFAGILLFYMTLICPYKSHGVLALQSAFFFNLCLLSGFTLFCLTEQNKMSVTQSYTIGVSTGVVFLQYCGIILYRIYTMCRQYIGVRERDDREAAENEVDILQENALLEINYCQPRLPLETQPLLADMQED